MNCLAGQQIDQPSHASGRSSWLEVAAIVTLFFLVAGCPPPDVNEAHYLAKAKHYWNPDWWRETCFSNLLTCTRFSIGPLAG